MGTLLGVHPIVPWLMVKTPKTLYDWKQQDFRAVLHQWVRYGMILKSKLSFQEFSRTKSAVE